MNVRKMMSRLEFEKITTWFDLGLFIDRFKENREVPSVQFSGSFEQFLSHLSEGGVAFITFKYSVDGATIECEKYARAIEEILDNPGLHYIAGEFDDKGESLLLPRAKRCQLDELASFDDWNLYHDFFSSKLERGGQVYNQLITKFWQEVLCITEKLGSYIEENHIRLLYLINTNSNPGNISFALGLIFLSEYLGVPVICNNHDFYWESGHSAVDIQMKRAKPGPRDHFFKNYHLGEVFSILEMIYPWESRSWLSVNINEAQCSELIGTHGHNPANVAKIDTAVNLDKFQMIIDEDRRTEILEHLAIIFGRENGNVPVESIADVLQKHNAEMPDVYPFLTGQRSQTDPAFWDGNIILLQPTRILSRKRIEVNFTLIEKLFDDAEFVEYFESNDPQKITILITGPIATGQYQSFYRLLRDFELLLTRINDKHRDKIFLGFLFSQHDKSSFKQQFDNPVRFAELYSIASLVLLPSETEGRGLPIIEAAACGVPVFCRRYNPEVAYSQVIGEHLPRSERLSVIEFTDPELSPEIIEQVKGLIFSPKAYEQFRVRNREIVAKRFGIQTLVNGFREILYRLYLQVNAEPETMKLARWSLEQYQNHLNRNREFASGLLNSRRRQYLAGYGQMAFMMFLKSLIDPSYFRVEEKQIRGRAMRFARDLVESTPDPTPLPLDLVQKFYNSVDSIFLYRKGEIKIRMDHSIAYRHRNKHDYPYRGLTPHELSGVINLLYNEIVAPPPIIDSKSSQISGDWGCDLATLYGGGKLAIDHVEELEDRLGKNVPIALSPGEDIELELELFVLHPVRQRLGLAVNERIHFRFFDRAELAPIYIILREMSLGNSLTAQVLKSHIYYGKNAELKLLFHHGICRIVPSQQLSVGIHFYEVGETAAEALKNVQAHKGILITVGDDAAMMTDIVDIERFHIGKVSHIVAGKILGVPKGSPYVQWVPAGLRLALAYPTPVQTGKDLSQTLSSFRFKQLCDSKGEDKVMQILKKDSEEKGTPIKVLLKKLSQPESKENDVSYSAINGLYDDGHPWAGIIAKIPVKSSDNKWQFSVVSTKDRPKTVLKFMEEFGQATGKKPRAAWNGGYILNPELVGKLGIPEIFIGSPLGLIISEGRVLSPPLFNKPAFVVMPDGSLTIRRVNCSQGITIHNPEKPICLPPETYNLDVPTAAPCFYDLLFDHEEFSGDGRVLVRLAGNRIKEIIHSKPGETLPVLPVGLTLSFPEGTLPGSWRAGQELDFSMNGWQEMDSAIEAGPQLLKDGQVCIEMELEGWKTGNSIRTQAARLDYTDMRGPKIAIGIDRVGDLSILIVNGRIRESVGATHHDMAEILKEQGMVDAMGFDPGGSSTLVVDNKALNISPYNPEYETDVYSLPPVPRAVANAIIVW